MMEQNLEEKLVKFGMPLAYMPASPEKIREIVEVLETLNHCLKYKTVDVRNWSYTGGRNEQVKRVQELAQLGDKAITAITKLAETGYKLDDYWDDKGSIGEEDIKVIKKLSDEKVMGKYLGIVSKAQGLFKNNAFFYQAQNALSMIDLLDFKEEDAEKAIMFIGQANYLGFFNQKTSVSSLLLEEIIRSDDKITISLLEKLRQDFGYKTVDVRYWAYTEGPTGQIRKILRLSRLGENALKVIDALARTGYKLDRYWDDKGSIGEEDVMIIQALSDKKVMEGYLNVVNKAQNFFKNKYFDYCAENALSMVMLSKFNEEESSKIVDFLHYCGYFNFFNQKSSSISKDTLKTILKHDIITVKKVFETLKQGFNYKTVNVKNWEYTGGVQGQIERVLKISKLEDITSVLEKLANAGYKLNDYWDEKGSIGRADVEVFDKLTQLNTTTREKNIDRYLEIVDEIKKTFKTNKINPKATNALSVIDLLKLSKEETSKVIKVTKYCNCLDFFNGESELPSNFLTPIAWSDTDMVKKVFETLEKRFNYKTINVKSYYYTGGAKGQLNRILRISELGEKAVDALGALADTGHKLDTCWSSGGSIGEYEVRAIKKLVETDTVELYKQVVERLRKLGYKVKPDLEQMVDITMIPESVNALDLLVSQGYKLDKEKIIREDINKIKGLAEGFFDKKLGNIKIGHKCFYKEDAKEFIRFFSSLKNVNDKKKIIKALMNCDHNNPEVIKWLDENEAGLIREVGILL